jgi:hypothetical protein
LPKIVSPVFLIVPEPVGTLGELKIDEAAPVPKLELKIDVLVALTVPDAGTAELPTVPETDEDPKRAKGLEVGTDTFCEAV